MTIAHLHLHKRKRSKKQRIKFFDRFIEVLGILNVAATLPQALVIWTEQSAAGVSSISWGYYTVFSAALLIYGLVHRAKPIIITYIGSTILYFVIFVGSLVY